MFAALTPSRPRLLLYFLLAAQAILIYARIRHSYFAADDFLNFEIYQETGFTPEYLLRDVFGQIVPGYRALHAGYFAAFGLHYAGSVGVCVAVSITSTLLIVLIGERLRAATWAIATGGIIYIFLLQPTHTQLWWSAATHTLPSLTATLVAIWCLVGPEGKGPTRAGRIAAAAWFGVGLLFTIKPLFSPIFFVALLLHIRRRDGVAWWSTIRSAVTDLLWCVPIAAIYCAVALSLWVPFRSPVSLGRSTHFVWLALADGTIAASLGLGTHGPAIPRLLSLALALVSVGGVVVWTIHTSKANGILWAGLLTYVVIAMAAVARHRAGEFGAGAALWLRYNVENATFLMLTGMVTAATVRIGEHGKRIAIGLAVLVAINLQIQSCRVGYGWSTRVNRSYVTNLRASLEAHPDAVFLNTTVPERIMPVWMHPGRTMAMFLPLFKVGAQVSDHRSATHVITAAGFVEPYTFRP